MKIILLKFGFLFMLSCFLSMGVATAQQVRFIYIQTENKQPFYVKTDNRILSSSVSGYLILPGLTDSVYQLIIGFPDIERQELTFTVNVKDTNAGFLLKNNTAGGWRMVSLQTMQLQDVKKYPELNAESAVNGGRDEFAEILAAVVNDPSIARVDPVKKAAGTPVITEEQGAVPVKPQSNDPLSNRSAITRLRLDSTFEGVTITYLDAANTDTVKVLLPANHKAAMIGEEKQTETQNRVSENVNGVNNEQKFINMELRNPNIKTDSGSILKDDFVVTEKKPVVNNASVARPEVKAAPLNTSKAMINSDCKKSATQDDFLKLRKQMAAEADEKSMIKVAVKLFVSKCFTTEQVKNLGVLFITEEEKYKFYVAAFPYVSDTDNFGVLEDQLTGNYYKTRFKAMLSH